MQNKSLASSSGKSLQRTALSWASRQVLFGALAAGALPAVAFAQTTGTADTANAVNTASTTNTAAAMAADRTGTTAANGAAATATATAATTSASLPVVAVKASVQKTPDALPAAYAGGQVAKGGSIGVLGTANVMDQPFNTTNYTSAAMKDQQARSISDIVTDNASVRAEQSGGGFGDVFQIRGFDVQATDVALNGLYGLVSASRMPVNMMERVEVLNGPGSLMYGMGPGGSIGGAINIVTKRADDKPLTEMSVLYQSKGQFGTAVDIGRRFGSEDQWGIRVNGQYKDGQTGIAHGNQSQGNASVGLDYRGQKLRWSFDAYNVSENTDEFRSQIGLGTATAIPAVPSAYSNLYPGTKLKLRDTAAATRLEYDVNQYFTLYGAAGQHYGTSEQNFPYAAGMTNTGNFQVANGYYDAYNSTRTIDMGVRAHFYTFGLHHTVTAGFTALNQEQGYFYALSSNYVASSLYNPTPLASVGADRTEPQRSNHTRLDSQQLVDSVSMLDDRILITGGFRHQRIGVDNYDTTTGANTGSYSAGAITPLAGIVIKPLKNISVYGNFTSGLTDGGTAPVGSANAGQVFAPYKSNQYEAGVKADWGRVITSVSVFQISQPNGVLNGTTNVYGYDGNTRVRGLELSAYGEVLQHLRLMASATFYNPKLSGTAGGATDGNNAAFIPNFTFNLGADYDLPWVPGLGLNARIMHTGAEYYNTSNTLRLPAWTRYDIGARYRTQIMRKNVVFRANIENLFGSRYWIAQSTYLTNAAPRTVLLSATVDF